MMNWIAALMAMGASKPRKQSLTCVKATLSSEIFAIMRLTWYRNGRPFSVEEMSIKHAEEGIEEALLMLVKEALKSGADISMLASCSPQELGIE